MQLRNVRSAALAAGLALGLMGAAGCDVPDMDDDHPLYATDQFADGIAIDSRSLSSEDLRSRERAVQEELGEGARELREGDRDEELREAAAEIGAARRGEGAVDRWLEGFASDRDVTIPAGRGAERY